MINIYSDDSDQSEDELHYRPYQRRKFVHYAFPNEVKERFRFTPREIELLIQTLGPGLTPIAKKNNALSETEKVLIALRYYASNDFYYSLGDSQGYNTLISICIFSLTNC
jgi:hypothetical protein